MDKKFFRFPGGYPRHIGLRSQISRFWLDKKTQEGTPINIQRSLGSNLMKGNMVKPSISFGPLGLVRKIFATEVHYHKLLKTVFDAFWGALSNETTFKLFYHADSTSLRYRRIHASEKWYIVPSQKHYAIKNFQYHEKIARDR